MLLRQLPFFSPLLFFFFTENKQLKKREAEGLSKTVREHFKTCFVCVHIDSLKLQATVQSHQPEPKISGRAEAIAGGAG